MSPGNSECQTILVEREYCSLQQLDLWADSLEDATGDAPNRSLDQICVRKVREELSSGSCRDPVFKAQARRKKFRSRRYEGEIAVRQSVVNRIRRWIQSSTMWGECPPLIDAFASKHLKRFPYFWTQQQNALFQPWNDAYLWMHPPNDQWEQCVSKLPFHGARGMAIQPVRKDADWLWDFGEVVLDWIDIPEGSPLFEDAQGTVHTTKTPYGIALFDVVCGDAEGEGWGDPDSEDIEPTHTRPAYRTDKNADNWDPPPQRWSSHDSALVPREGSLTSPMSSSLTPRDLLCASHSESDSDLLTDTEPD